jgi:amidase
LLEILKNLDNETKAGKSRGFTWYSVVIKDNIITADKMQTTAGSLA